MLHYKSIQLIPGIEKYSEQFIFPDNTYRNWNAFEKKVSGINGPEFITLCDPQTSGGLLVAVEEKVKKDVIDLLKEERLYDFIRPIGNLSTKNDVVVEVRA